MTVKELAQRQSISVQRVESAQIVSEVPSERLQEVHAEMTAQERQQKAVAAVG